MKHKYADVLIAIAEGKIVQYKGKEDSYFKDADLYVLENNKDPFTFPDLEWRVKPEPKPDVVLYGHAGWIRCNGRKDKCEEDDCKFTFDGETGKLKSAEVIS